MSTPSTTTRITPEIASTRMNSERIACAAGEARIEDRQTLGRAGSTGKEDESAHAYGVLVRARLATAWRHLVATRPLRGQDENISGADGFNHLTPSIPTTRIETIKQLSVAIHLGRFIEWEGHWAVLCRRGKPFLDAT